MVYASIWKDLEYETTEPVVDYHMYDNDSNLLLSGETTSMPGRDGVVLNINKMVDEYLKPDLARPINQVTNEVVPNPDAFRVFNLYVNEFTTTESYSLLYDWSYEGDWDGEDQYSMSKPINGHLDPRMKMLATVFNLSRRHIDWRLESEE